MTRLKSLFISAFVTALMVALVHSLIVFYQQGFSVAWLGVAVAVWPAAGFFIRIFLTAVPRTSEHLSALLVAGVVGALVTVLSGHHLADPWPIGYAFGLGVIGNGLYIFWYSRFQQRNKNILKVGAPLPEFQLQDESGDVFSSTRLKDRPALLLFYRGNWCPLCMAQIKEIAGHYKKLVSLGVEVVLVSPQPHRNTRQLADKFQVPFRFLVDEQNRAATALGILAPNGTPAGLELLGYDSDTVMPTVVLTDAAGKIIYADLTDNYRVRPEPELFLEIFERHGIG